jgi:hypothetical protein
MTHAVAPTGLSSLMAQIQAAAQAGFSHSQAADHSHAPSAPQPPAATPPAPSTPAPAPSAAPVTDPSVIAPQMLSALLDVQERLGDAHLPGRAAEAVGEAIDWISDHWPHAHRPRPEPAPEPIPQPVPTPPPAPAPVPTPAPVVDSEAPARQLAQVLESLHEASASQFPSVPFSERNRPPVPANPAAAVWSERPAMAQRTYRAAMQGQAAVAVLQSLSFNMGLFAATGPQRRPYALFGGYSLFA